MRKDKKYFVYSQGLVTNKKGTFLNKKDPQVRGIFINRLQLKANQDHRQVEAKF